MNRRAIERRLARGGAGLRILLIRGSSLGDIAHALPAALSLRRQLPAARLSWLVHRPYVPLLRALAPVDALLPFEREALRPGKVWPLRRRLLGFLRALRGARYHIVIDIQGLARTALFAAISGAPIRIGRAEARETTLLYTRRQRRASPRPHPIVGACALLGALGLDPAPPRERPRLRGVAAARAALARQGHRPGAIALAPGARWPSKVWPEGSWSALARELAPRPIQVFGGAEEAASAAAIAEAGGGRSFAGATDLLGLALALEEAALVIAGDSGPLHLAAVLGRPVVGIYGPTEWRRTYPYGRHALAIRQGLSCLACRERRCPLPHHPCMRELIPEAIAALARAALAQGPLVPD